MDRQSRIREALAAMNDPAYLAALSSVGEYKRACKQLETSGADAVFEDDVFRVRVGGETVTLGERPETFRCTCPSPVICRHILAAIMTMGVSAPETPASVSEPQPCRPEPGPDEIRAMVGEKTFRAAVGRYAASQIEIKKQGALVNGYRVAFLSGRPPEEAACSCKKSRCEHLALALLKAWSQRTGGAVTAEVDPPDPNTRRLIGDCLDLMAGLLQKGIYAATQADARLLLFYSLNLSRYAAVLGKDLRSLALLLEEVLENRMFADEGKLIYHFCRACNLLRAVQEDPAPDVLARLIGPARSVYRTVASAPFVSLGLYPFFTDSGYVGATHLLCGDDGICALSSLVPTIYEEWDDERLYKEAAARRDMLFPSLAGHKLVLHAFKKNAVNGLSPTDETVAEDKGIAGDGITELDEYETDYAAIERRTAVVDYFAAYGPRRYAVVPYATLSAAYDPAGAVTVTLGYGKRRMTADLACDAVTRRACELLLGRDRQNGIAVLEETGGGYALRTLIEQGACVPLYFEETPR